MTKRASLKKYGDWLFEDKSSIIYEQRRDMSDGEGYTWPTAPAGPDLSYVGARLRSYLTPDVVTDIFQFVVGLGGAAFPPLDVANAMLYAARGMWGQAIFSLLALVPAVGDALQSVTSAINAFVRVGGRSLTQAGVAEIGSLVTQLTRNASFRSFIRSRINGIIVSLIDWFNRHTINLGAALNVAKTYAVMSSRPTSSAPLVPTRPVRGSLTEQILTEEVTADQAIASGLDRSAVSMFLPMINGILSNDRIKTLIVQEYDHLISGITEAKNMLENFQLLVVAVEHAIADESATPAPTSTGTAATTTTSLREIKYSDVRLKKLSGIL